MGTNMAPSNEKKPKLVKRRDAIWAVLAVMLVLIALFYSFHEGANQSHARGTEKLLTEAAEELEVFANQGSETWNALAARLNALKKKIPLLEGAAKSGAKLAELEIEIKELELAIKSADVDSKAVRVELLGLAASLKERANTIRLSSSDFWDSLFAILAKILTWIGPALLFAVLLFIVVWSFPPSERSFLSKLKSGRIGPDGFSFESSVPEQKRRIIDSYNDIKEMLGEQYSAKLQDVGIQGDFETLFEEITSELKSRGIDLAQSRSRCCVYVPSYIDEGLVQATNYVGTQLGAQGERRGRVFSQRYGIIGRGFRSRSAVYNPKVSSDTMSLINDWGLTFGEAEKQSHDDMSLLALPIGVENQQGDPIGLMYLEINSVNALEQLSQEAAEVATLMDGVARGCDSYDALVKSLDVFKRSMRL